MLSNKILAVMAGLLIALTILPAQAIIIGPVAYRPNHYFCKGNKITVTLGLIGPIGTERLSINFGNKAYSADAPNINTEPTLIGNLKETPIKIIPDVETIMASVIIPTIILGSNTLGSAVSSVKFSSQLIITTKATPFIAGPYLGVENPSKYYNLSCTATYIPVG